MQGLQGGLKDKAHKGRKMGLITDVFNEAWRAMGGR